MKKKNKNNVLPLLLAAAAGLLLAIGLMQLFDLGKDVELAVQYMEAAKTPGEMVTIGVVLQNDAEFTDVSFGVDYDRSRLELLHVNDTYIDEDGGSIEYLPGARTATAVREDGCGYLEAAFETPEKEAGTMLCSMTFRILDLAPVGVADVWLFDAVSSRTKANGTVAEIDCVTAEGNILVGDVLCNHMDEGRDTICDLCGRKIADVKPFEISYINVSFDNMPKLNFYVKRDYIGGAIRDLTAFAVQTITSSDVVKEIPGEDWKLFGDYYRISVPVSVAEMTDPVKLEIQDGRGYVYSSCGGNVRDYLYEILAEYDDPEMITAIVDLLNFGSVAQRHYAYKINDLSNSALTQEQQAMATPVVACEDIRVMGERCLGSLLYVKGEIKLAFVFDGISEEAAEDMEVEVSFTDLLGEKRYYDLDETPVLEKYEDYGYGLILDQLTILDVSQPVTVTVKNVDGTEYDTVVDSIESYISRKGYMEETKEFYENLMKFSVSAKAYWQQ